MRILVADDDVDSRQLLRMVLRKWDHDVVTAKDGDEAMTIIQNESIDFVISDWMMPKIDGAELCRKIRSTTLGRYVYIILLTAKNAQDELVAGMEAGADDFVGKPFNQDELKVRVCAGARMIDLQKNLAQQNQQLKEAYSVIEKDLQSAADLQKSFLPTQASAMAGVTFDWLFLPSAFVAGDSFNFFKLDDGHIGFYLLDVAGHGISAAMMSVMLSKVLVPPPVHVSESNVTSTVKKEFLSPAKRIEALNNQFQNDDDAMRYFTMVYGILDTHRDLIRLTQAGHPSPLLCNKNGTVSVVGAGGMPVGMLPDISYDEVEFEFKAGDRLFVFSDGITECTNDAKGQFSDERLRQYLRNAGAQPLRRVLTGIEDRLRSWNGSGAFADDVSLLAVERKGNESD